MTPSEIQSAIEEALSQKELFPWWSYVLWSLFTAVGVFIGMYLKEKGVNLATKEDVGNITDEIEGVRSDYKKENDRYQLLASGLLKKRAEVIESIYHLLADTEEAFGRFVDLAEWKEDPSKDDLRKAAGELLYKFLREYKKNRIYFSESLCDKLQGFSNLIYKITIPYSIGLTAQIEGEALKDFTERWVTAKSGI